MPSPPPPSSMLLKGKFVFVKSLWSASKQYIKSYFSYSTLERGGGGGSGKLNVRIVLSLIVVEKMYAIVKLQYADMRCAHHGHGNYEPP